MGNLSSVEWDHNIMWIKVSYLNSYDLLFFTIDQ